MPSLAPCRCPFRLMRRCFLGRWICQPVSERFRLVWRCRLCDYSTYIPFCVQWHGGQCLRRLVPNYAVVFRLCWVCLLESLCHAGHCRRSRDEIISDVLLWTPTYSRAKAGRPARTYIQQLCEDTGCSPEDLPEAMNDREKWRERVRDIRASGMTWWWWWWKQNVPLLRRAVKVMTGWSNSWGREQCRTLRLRNLLGNIMIATTFFSIKWSLMWDVNRAILSSRWGDATWVICSKVWKSLTGLKRHMATQLLQESNQETSTAITSFASHFCLRMYKTVIGSKNHLRGHSRTEDVNTDDARSSNSRTTIPQSNALTITPRGPPPRIYVCIQILNKWKDVDFENS